MTTTALAGSSEILSALFDGGSDGLCLLGPDGAVLRANPRWLRSAGLSAAQAAGGDALALLPPASEEERALHDRARRGERVAVPLRRVVALGRESWWEGSIAPIPMQGGVGLLLTAREVSHPQGPGPLDAAREVHQALRLFVEHSPSPAVMLDAGLRYLAASPGWYRIAGHGPEALGKHLYDVAPWLPARYREVHRRCLAGAVERVDEDRYARPDGAVVRGSWVCQPWRTSRGQVGGILIQAHDATDQKTAERAAQRAALEMDRARLQGLGSRINDIELVVRLDGAVVHVNDRAVACYGHAREELERMNVRDLQVPETRHEVGPRLALAGAEGDRFEAIHLRRDGCRFPAEVSTRGFTVGGERFLHTIVRDLTEQREAQAANQRLVAELQRSLQQVKTLKGLLPICMYCHKIRDDAGYWSRIEAYLSEHTDAHFSHGLCPECVEKRYPREADE